jgi:hypothetical protein
MSMRKLMPYLLCAVVGCAMARDAPYKPPIDGATATIRLSALDYGGSNLLRTEDLSMVVQRVERVGRKCEPQTLGWIDYASKEKTYAIAAEKIASFGVKHTLHTLTRENLETLVFAFIPERDHRYEFQIGVNGEKVAVKVYDETSERTLVPVEIHYLIICARQNAAENALPQKQS